MRLALTRVAQACLLLPSLAILKVPLFGGYCRFLMSTWTTPERRGRLDRIFYPMVGYLWFRLEYWPVKDPDVREAKKAALMGGVSGRHWAAYYDSQPVDLTEKIGTMTVREAQPVYATLESILDAAVAEVPCYVVQVGSSSGREIAWVAAKFPGARCVGTDVYPEVVEYSTASHHLPNLEFRVLGARDIGELVTQLPPGRLVVFSSASLQYVQPEHLKSFFSSLSARDNVDVLVDEPVSTKHGDPTRLRTSVPRAVFSYTHNYKWIAEECGLTTVTCKVVRPHSPSHPHHGRTALYFWWGRTRSHEHVASPGAAMGSLAESVQN